MSGILQAQSCAVRGYHVQYNFGVRYFLLKDYEEAKTWFEGALAASNIPEKRLKSHLAVGACCNELGESVCALEQFTSAHAFSKPPIEPMLINNLAASQIGMGLE